MRSASYSTRLGWFLFSELLLSTIVCQAQVTTAPKQGIRENDPRTHALTNARIVTAPGKSIEKGTVLIRGGVIVEAGPSVKIPSDARVWDLTGKIIVTNTTTKKNVEELQKRNLHILVTVTPRLEGRSFGTNVMEATLLALMDKPQSAVTSDDFLGLINQIPLEPNIEVLN
jgi:hypothetical protein